MTGDLLRAKALLAEGYTCVLICGDKTETSRLRGVAPLLAWLNGGANFHGFSAADKVVGKAAAFLYVLLGVKEVYADTVSEKAEQVLQRYGIPLSHREKTAAIQNRTNTGLCPMERATWEIDDPLLAKAAIEQTLAALRSEKQ